MTREIQAIADAAKLFTLNQSQASLARLVTAVMDLPLNQWPEGACERKAKKAKGPLAPLVVHRGPKPEPGDAAHPDKIVDLETGEKKLP
jgi:hypothetical protein